MKKNQRIIIMLLISIYTATILIGCNQQEEEKPIIMVDSSAIEVAYNMDEISTGDVLLTQKISCKYTQTEDQQISFETGGKAVDKVYVKVGDYVEEGDLLLTMETGDILDRIAELEYKIARNKLLLGYLDKAEEFDKQSEEYTYVYEYYSPQSEEELNKRNHKIYMIEEDYNYRRQDYNDEIDYDGRKLQELKKEYEDNHVYATMAGKVVDIKADLEGSIAKKDDVIMSIVDNDNGLFIIEDKEAAKYFEEGQSVPMSIVYGAAKGDYEIAPHNMSGWGDNLEFEIVSSPQSATLEVGISGTVIATVDKRKDVLRIANKALYEADGKYYTYVLGKNNMREPKFIDIGLVGDNYSEVLGGIEAGAKVVSR